MRRQDSESTARLLDASAPESESRRRRASQGSRSQERGTRSEIEGDLRKSVNVIRSAAKDLNVVPSDATDLLHVILSEAKDLLVT
jgi:hypothetical protein